LPSILGSALGFTAISASAAEPAARERLLADSGPANVEFSDASWRRVNLPHDWAVELPFDRNAHSSHGFKAIEKPLAHPTIHPSACCNLRRR